MKDNNFNEFMNELVDDSHESKVDEQELGIHRIIDKEGYEGIRDQDGWETLELTVREKYPEQADRILRALKKVGESKVNEQLPEDDDEPIAEPEEPKAAPPDEPVFPGDEKEDETAEITKEYVGRTEDTHYYLISKEADTGEREDLQIVDQEGILKYSAKDNNLELDAPDEFVIKAIQDVEIDEIERSIFMKYILPLLVEEEEPEEEEEEEEEEVPEIGKKKKPKEFEEEEEPEEEFESKKKVDEQALDLRVGDRVAYRRRPEFGKGTVDSLVSSSKVMVKWDKKDDVGEISVYDLRRVEESKKKVNEIIDYSDYSDEELKKLVRTAKDRKDPNLSDYVAELRRRGISHTEMYAKESKKKLIEMIVTDGEDNSFEVSLIDDGTDDTVLDINGKEFRFGGEFSSLWRSEEGELSEEGLEELALDALANLEDEEYNELVSTGEEQETAAVKSGEEGGVVGDDKKPEGFSRKYVQAVGSAEKESKGENMKNNKVNEGDVSKDVKALQKAAYDAIKDGDYIKAQELTGRLSQIQQAIPDGVEAPKDDAEVKDEVKPPVEPPVEPAVDTDVTDSVTKEGKVDEQEEDGDVEGLVDQKDKAILLELGSKIVQDLLRKGADAEDIAGWFNDQVEYLDFSTKEAKEGKVPDDKDSEDTKIKKLTEKDKEAKAKADKAKKDKEKKAAKDKKEKAEKEKKAKAKKESKDLPESKDLKLLKRLLGVGERTVSKDN